MTEAKIVPCKWARNVFAFISTIGFLAASAAAQTPSLSLSGASGAPGATVNLNVSLSPGTGAPSAIQWDLTYATSDLTLETGTFYATGAAASGAGKSADCGSISAGNVRCIVAGLDTTAIGSGMLATLTFKIATGTTDTSTSVSVVSPEASDGNANALSITGSGATVTINHPAAVATTTGVIATNSTISVDGSTMLTATVTAASGTTSPTGTVSFKLGQTVLGTVALSGSGGTATASLTVNGSQLATGANTVTASYAGNDSFTESSGSVSITVVSATVTAVSVTPNSGSGASHSFALQYSDTAGAANLQFVYAWFNTNLTSAASSCILYYQPSTNQLNLLNDGATAWQAATLGSATTLQNSQCSVNVATATAVPSGNTLTLTLAMTFQPAYAGARNIYMFDSDVSGSNSGWQQEGTWTVSVASGVPTTVSVTPSSGSGASHSFALQYSDTAGAGSLQFVYAWFNTNLTSAASSCILYYQPATNQLNLLNDGATAWQAATLGSATILQNSQCSVNVATATAVPSGNTLTLTLAMTFQPAYAGAKNTYMFDSDVSGSNSGWQQEGTWTVSAGSGTPAVVSATPNSGSGASQSFALEYSDTAGAANLQVAYVWFNTTLTNAVNSCMLYYQPSTNQLNLLDDAGTAWLVATPGAATTLQNSQCSLNVAATTVVLNGDTLTVNLAMTFTQAYAGAQNTYMFAMDASGSDSGWQQPGTWTVP